MKSILFLVFVLFVFNFSNAQTTNFVNNSGGKTSWERELYDFGEIPQGVPVSTSFKFTNSGSAPVLISDVKTTCGCTVPSYPKEPIMPGKTGIIKAQYNAANVGSFNKTITVITNVGEKQLTIKGVVKEAGN